MTGFDPISIAIWSKAADILSKLVEKTGWADANLQDKVKQAIFRASGQYIQRYKDRHGILKVLGMREPVLLESIYTTVQFLDNAAIESFDSIEGLEKAYRQSNHRQFRSEEPKKCPGLDIANQTQYLMVLGGPGMGKSTFLRKMGLEALKGLQKDGYQHSCLPVFVELKEFRAGEIDIKAAISREFETCGFPEHDRFTEQALRKGKLLVLLDGLDEVPTDRMSEAINRIQNFVDRYSNNRFITSCRVAAYRHNFKRFTDVKIADFDDEQIQRFITNWFSSQPDRGKECWDKLSSDEYAAAKELTHTPLLLTLICLLYQRAGQFPTNRATLYEKALRVLLEEWAGEKELPQEVLYKGLDTKRKELMLAEIAHDAFQEDRLFLSKREIVSQIERILKDMLPEEKFVDGTLVLKAIEVQHGVLVERAGGIYSFSHLTVQEFLTAQYIVDDDDKVKQLVTNHLSNNRWREVFLLLTGLKRADKLLLQMEQHTQTLVKSSKVKALLQWADQITDGSEGEYKSAAKRGVAIAIASDIDIASVIDRAIDIASVIASIIVIDFARASNSDSDSDRAIDRAKRLQESRIFKDVDFNRLIAQLEALKIRVTDHSIPRGEALRIYNQLRELWYSILKLPAELQLLSKSELQELTYYLEANLLIVRCKQAAVQVSQKIWEEIEARLLKVNF